jgi:hypothetical protein
MDAASSFLEDYRTERERETESDEFLDQIIKGEEYIPESKRQTRE